MEERKFTRDEILAEFRRIKYLAELQYQKSKRNTDKLYLEYIDLIIREIESGLLF